MSVESIWALIPHNFSTIVDRTQKIRATIVSDVVDPKSSTILNIPSHLNKEPWDEFFRLLPDPLTIKCRPTIKDELPDFLRLRGVLLISTRFLEILRRYDPRLVFHGVRVGDSSMDTIYYMFRPATNMFDYLKCDSVLVDNGADTISGAGASNSIQETCLRWEELPTGFVGSFQRSAEVSRCAQNISYQWDVAFFVAHDIFSTLISEGISGIVPIPFVNGRNLAEPDVPGAYLRRIDGLRWMPPKSFGGRSAGAFRKDLLRQINDGKWMGGGWKVEGTNA